MHLRSKFRALAIAVGAIAVVVAIAASPAMAEIVSTKFNANSVKLSGTVTVKKNGAEAKTCELKSATGKVTESPGSLQVYTNSTDLQTYFSCTGGTAFSLGFYSALGRYNTTTGAYSLNLVKVGSAYQSPWGQYYPGYYTGGEIIAGWTNGSETTPSTIDFNELNVGALVSGFAKITVNGSLTATTSTGGLLTQSH